MDFVLALHSHLPYVLNHGRWPHGSDWITEAAIDTYLPLVETIQSLAVTGVRTPITIGFTPILANQLESPVFVAELERYFAQRLTACDEAPDSLRTTGDAHLLPLVDYWRARLTRLRNLFRALDGHILAPFRRWEAEGRLEIIGSAATHGFLPLLGRDESIRLHLHVGRHEHQRIFGRPPRGCWVPECAYRSRGPWQPLPEAPDRGIRRGIEEHLADAGFQFFFADSHMARAGSPLGLYGDPTTAEWHLMATGDDAHWIATRTPYRAYRVSTAPSRHDVVAFIRDPNSSAQVWSRHHGYPGDGSYLEFHKIRWPGGLKLWRVTGRGVDLGGKEPYDPVVADATSAAHGRHFASLLGEIAGTHPAYRSGVVVAPFDTELFGHWWHEGVDWIGHLYRSLGAQTAVRVTTGSAHLARTGKRSGLRLATGSWGANGDYSMWLNPQTTFTWPRIWAIEDEFWAVARQALMVPAAHAPLAQLARAMLLLQSSDWQFIISTGAVADYAIRRFDGHADDCHGLLAAIRHGLATGEFGHAHHLAATLHERDDIFPDILQSVRTAIDAAPLDVAEVAARV